MNYGKVSDQIYDRSIYKVVGDFGFHEKEKINGAGLGTDCAVLALAQGFVLHTQSQSYGRDSYVAARAVIDACNKIAAYGVDISQSSLQISLQIHLSSELREAKLKGFVTEASQFAAKYQIPIVDVQAVVIPNMQHAIVTASVTGNISDKEHILLQGNAKPEQDIVMTKWMGLEGAAVMATMKKAELETRYPLSLIEETQGFTKFLSCVEEIDLAKKAGISAAQVVRDGGIFGGLWQLAEHNHLGLVVDLKKISVKQEVIETCEFFDHNPYKLISGGCMLFTTEHGAQLVTILEEQGIKAAIIGRTVKGNDRLIQNGEESRYLEPAREDEIYKVIQ